MIRIFLHFVCEFFFSFFSVSFSLVVFLLLLLLIFFLSLLLMLLKWCFSYTVLVESNIFQMCSRHMNSQFMYDFCTYNFVSLLPSIRIIWFWTLFLCLCLSLSFHLISWLSFVLSFCFSFKQLPPNNYESHTYHSGFVRCLRIALLSAHRIYMRTYVNECVYVCVCMVKHSIAFYCFKLYFFRYFIHQYNSNGQQLQQRQRNRTKI